MRSYAAVPAGVAVAYRHRDPLFVGPARRAELAARDAARGVRGGRPAPRPRDLARRAAFAEARGRGLTVTAAAAIAGVSRRTAYARWEPERAAGTLLDEQ